MSNSIQHTNINVSNFVDTTSRYLSSKVIYYNFPGNRKVLTLNTYKRTPQSISTEDRFTIVTASTQYRPDIISNSVYGVPHYWWKIMEFNNIHDIMDFKLGITIRLPTFL